MEKTMTPEEIKDHTLEFQIWPAVGGWIVRVSRRGASVTARYYCLGVEDIVTKLKEETREFYCEETDALERKIDADVDVAGACCPECEDQVIVEKP